MTLKDIYFAGGCFWGVEEYFSRIPGVEDVTSGYANGMTGQPSYEEVCSGLTGHAETVHVRYNPDAVSLRTLAERFFRIIDPVSVNRQGNDAGPQYRTGMYYVDPADRQVLEAVMREEQSLYEAPLAVELMPLKRYDLAESYHQDYLRKNPGGYCHIDFNSLKDLPPSASPTETAVETGSYTRPDPEILKQRLSPEAWSVTQKDATEPPFSGAYWDHAEPGLYVDVTTGEPLFSSEDKFDSACGWPSFSRPLEAAAVREREDVSFGMERTEVRSRVGDAHLGHVFDDGPVDRGGLRYCINSAALRFVPYADLDKEGYGAFKKFVLPE